MSKKKRQTNYSEACEQLPELEDAGHEVIRFVDYHWRIDGIDVWPSTKKYMKNGIVKKYENLKDILI